MRAAAAFFLLLVLAPVSTAARCLAYGPARVDLTGQLTAKTFPGPPGYTSVGQGDYPEVIYILHLDRAVCVMGDPTSRTNGQSHADVTDVQLSVPPKRVRFLTGKRVRVSGTLFGATTGHHHTPVVLQVSSLRAAE